MVDPAVATLVALDLAREEAARQRLAGPHGCRVAGSGPLAVEGALRPLQGEGGIATQGTHPHRLGEEGDLKSE